MRAVNFGKAAKLAAVLAVVALPAASQGTMIPVPNGDFQDNTDGDLLTVEGWSENENQGADEVQMIDGAVDKAPGDYVLNTGFKFDFSNPTVALGVNFDSSLTYTLSMEARAFNDIALTDAVGAMEDDWGFLFRDLTNGINIKTLSQPNPIDGESWQTLSLVLTPADMAQYESDNGVDIDAAEIGVRIFKNPGTADFVAVDNITLEAVPEPATALLSALALGAVALSNRRR